MVEGKDNRFDLELDVWAQRKWLAMYSECSRPFCLERKPHYQSLKFCVPAIEEANGEQVALANMFLAEMAFHDFDIADYRKLDLQATVGHDVRFLSGTSV